MAFNLENLAGKLRPGKALFGIRQAKVGKYITAPVIYFGLFVRSILNVFRHGLHIFAAATHPFNWF